MKHLLYFSLFCFCMIICSCGNNSSNNSNAQNDTSIEVGTYQGKLLNRFDIAIENMEKEDSTRTALEGEILFTGSSSIRLWKTLEMDMHPIPVINRGFGGSMIPEVIHYADRVVFPYEPEIIVFYCGENDIAEGALPEEVFESFKKFDEMIQKRLKGTQMIYISMKPSPARWELWDKFVEANELIREYIENQDHLLYFDSSALMLNEAGTPDSTIFIEDGLHMNAAGYDRWKSGLKPMIEVLVNPPAEQVSE